MTPSSLPADDDLRQVERLLDRFDRDWSHAEQPPNLRTFLEESQRLGFEPIYVLTELICIDAEHRWKSPDRHQQHPLGDASLGLPPIFDTYRQLFPEVQQCAQLECDLAELQQRLLSDSDLSRDASFATIDDSKSLTARSDVGSGTPPDSKIQVEEDEIKAAEETTNDAAASRSIWQEELPPRYRLMKRLGRGTFGEVWRAHDSLLDRPVAIKSLNVNQVSAKAPQKLLSEARAAASVRHPNLVAIHDVIETPSALFMIMEVVEGRSFDRWAVRHSLHEQVKVLADVASAVHAAHKIGLVHCDLKPDNVLVDDQSRAYVADFGLAIRYRDQRELKGRVFGSPAFLSPEQVRGEGHRLDGRADIWALGVMLYQVLAGELPFVGATLPELFEEIQFRPARPPRQSHSQIPEVLEAICLQCLKKNCEERFNTASDLEVALRQWLSGSAEKTSAEPPRSAIRPVVPAPPPLANELIGREAILDQILAFFTNPHPRLLTLLGPSGVGKTSLAIVAANSLLKRFPGVVLWAELQSARDTKTVCAMMRNALTLPAPNGEESPEAIGEALRLFGPCLLILDNCEQIVDCLSPLVRQWLHQVPQLRVLATSQVGLGIREETTMPVLPLAVPTAADEPILSLRYPFGEPERIRQLASVQMLMTRAAQKGFEVPTDDSQWELAAKVCRRLEGLPLALELAAARLPLLGLAELSERLEESFDVLSRRRHDGPQRHQTLHSAICWSLSLLSDVDRLGLQCMVQWPAPLPLRLWEKLLSGEPELRGAEIDILQELQHRSLARILTCDGQTWLEVVPPVRQSVLTESANLFDAEDAKGLGPSLAAIRIVLRDAESRLPKSSAKEKELLAENLSLIVQKSVQYNACSEAVRAAVLADQAAENRTAASLRIQRLEALRNKLGNASALTVAGPPLPVMWQAKLLLALANACQSGGEYQRAGQLAREVIDLAVEDGECSADAQQILGESLYELGNYELARLPLQEAQREYTVRGNAAALAHTLAIQGRIDWRTGRYDAAAEKFAIALAYASQSDLPSLRSELIRDQGNLLLLKGEPESALSLFLEAENISVQSGDRRAVTLVLNSHAAALAELGRYAEADRLYQRAEDLCRTLGDPRGLAKLLNNRAIALIDQGEFLAALPLLQQAEQANRRLGHAAGICISLATQATAHLGLLQPQTAIESLDQAAIYLPSLSGSTYEATMHGDRGEALRLLGREKEACKELDHALQLLNAIGGEKSPEAFLYHAQRALADKSLVVHTGISSPDYAAESLSLAKTLATELKIHANHHRHRLRTAYRLLESEFSGQL